MANPIRGEVKWRLLSGATLDLKASGRYALALVRCGPGL